MTRYTNDTEEVALRTHQPCGDCGSSDALAVYPSHTFCFSCGQRRAEKASGEAVASSRRSDLLPGEYRGLEARGLTEETCRKWGYQVGTHHGAPVQIANYYKDGAPVAQKVRTRDKKFTLLGETKKLPLYGAWLWNSGKMVVVTEGEIDALTVSQVQGHKWPVVSVPNGAQGAAKSIAENLDYLDKFEKVILMFDNDKHGAEAAKACAEVLPIGKAFVAKLPEGFKDPNDLLKAGKAGEITHAMWNAKEYRPEGILTVSDVKAEALRPIEVGRPWAWPTLTKLTYGRRLGENYAIGAGVGAGKTDFFTQQIAFDITELQEPCGVIYLEQNPGETLKRIAGKIRSKNFHIPDDGWTQKELEETLGDLEKSNMLRFYNHFGSTEWKAVKNAIRYMAKAYGIRHFYLDHLTALAAHADDERRFLDGLMADLAGLCQELQIIVHFISHLTTPDGTPHEEGGRVMAKHFRGSRALMQWAFFMLGLERNQQAETLEERQTSTIRVVKDRYTGRANGETFRVRFDPSCGRLNELEDLEDPEECPFDLPPDQKPDF